MMKLRPLQALFSALLLMLVVGLIGEFGINLEQERVRQEQRSRVTMAIGQYRAALEAELNASLRSQHCTGARQPDSPCVPAQGQ
jgi:sensor domain CHASE-containing protein